MRSLIRPWSQRSLYRLFQQLWKQPYSKVVLILVLVVVGIVTRIPPKAKVISSNAICAKNLEHRSHGSMRSTFRPPSYIVGNDWKYDRKCAYATYISMDKHYSNAPEEMICGLMMMLTKLKETGSKLDFVILSTLRNNTPLAMLENAGAKIVKVKKIDNGADFDFGTGATKLHVFGMTEYERVIYLDNDAMLLDNLDELCYSGADPSPLVGADAYWYDPSHPSRMSAALFVAKPDNETERFIKWSSLNYRSFIGYFGYLCAAGRPAYPNLSEMEILNLMYGETMRLLPTEYLLVTLSLLSSSNACFDAQRINDGTCFDRYIEGLSPLARLAVQSSTGTVGNKIKYVHFSMQEKPGNYRGKSLEKVLKDLGGNPESVQGQLWLEVNRKYIKGTQNCVTELDVDIEYSSESEGEGGRGGGGRSFRGGKGKGTTLVG